MSAAAFDLAFAFVLRVEGGDTNDPDDPGGLTRFGIAQKKNPDVDVANLTVDGAKAIYRERYWSPIRGDELPPKIAFAMFDSAVNQGVGTASTLLQRALNMADQQRDGVVGNKTLAALAKRDPDTVMAFFMAHRAIHYFELTRVRPVMEKYKLGWLRRLFLVMQAVGEVGR